MCVDFSNVNSLDPSSALKVRPPAVSSSLDPQQCPRVSIHKYIDIYIYIYIFSRTNGLSTIASRNPAATAATISSSANPCARCKDGQYLRSCCCKIARDTHSEYMDQKGIKEAHADHPRCKASSVSCFSVATATSESSEHTWKSIQWTLLV